MARHPLKVEDYIEKLAHALLVGATYELAALYAGISHDTFLKWRKQAAKAPAGTPLADLRERLKDAEGRAAIGWLAHIEKAAIDGDWKAAAWKLERRYPENYGRTMQKIALTDPSGEQPWDGTMGLAVLLHTTQIPQLPTNGHALPPPAYEPEP